MGDFLLELVGEIVDETAVALGLKQPLADAPPKPLHPALATLGYAAIGVFCGVVSLLIWRKSFIADRFAVASLCAAPVLGGIATLGIGLRLRIEGHHRRATSFTTFWGGAGFAFGIALIRFGLAL